MKKNIAVIGLGLMGASMALAIKEKYSTKIFGIDKNIDHKITALNLNIIDEIIEIKDLEKQEIDLVIVATPVDTISKILIEVLDKTKDNTMVVDLGSTKEKTAKTLVHHPKRKNYIALHPIAGTEYSGPQSAFSSLYKGKVNIICDAHLSDVQKLSEITEMLENIGMRNRIMTSKEHDKHIAYVSHLSHVSSFMLGKTVLKIEKEEKNIFDMAGSGFESTVRLAKSSPEMWSPIFLENSENINQALGNYIDHLKDFQKLIIDNKKTKLIEEMTEINHLKNILIKK